MALVQGLVQKITTGVTMTPQMQQAIKLLQMSSVELEQEIQKALDENPMLEIDDTFDQPIDSDAELAKMDANLRDIQSEISSDSLSDIVSRNESSNALGAETDVVVALESSVLPDDNNSPLDTSWENTWDEGLTPAHKTPSSLIMDDDYEYQGATVETLKDHLLWQLNLSPFTKVDEAIAKAVIDAIDDLGYLTESEEDLALAAKNILLETKLNDEGIDFTDVDIDDELSKIDDIDCDEVKVVIKRVQHFEPVGVAARNMQESLRIQLEQLYSDDPAYDKAMRTVTEFIDLLGKKDFTGLGRKLKVGEEELRSIISLIRRLDPQPGAQYNHDDSQYVRPDVLVKKIKDEWKVELNPENTPKLKVNNSYSQVLSSNNSPDDVQYIKSHTSEAKWFINALETRNQTLLKVATWIVKYQQDFLEYGPEKMKPLILSEIAQEVGIHESTVSRVTTQKFMQTPKGLFELKFFFSSHVATQSGGECSSTAVQAMIKKIISSENPRKPYSDITLVELLAKEGINVARRTVTKYREALNIPSSTGRKQLV